MSIRARLTMLFSILFVIQLLSGCTSTRPSLDANDPNNGTWLSHLLNYEQSLAASHPDRVENMFRVNDDIRSAVRAKFNKGDKHRRARELANWLINQDGHNMTYDLEANLTPSQAFLDRRGNCLSFTILLVTLANDLGIELHYNDVDLPSTWDLDEEAGYVFYRHVNAIFKTNSHTQVFDLAMQDYDARFPQRTISQRSAGALLHSNLGVEALKERKFDLAFHHLKLAVSLDPQNSDLWINLGAAYKRSLQTVSAEMAFKVALKLDDHNSLAASNLERLYRSQSRYRLAERFQKIAARSRLNNPYIQYRNAGKQLKKSELKLARKSIRRAIKLHDQDPRFFELSSRINQRLKRYKPALSDLAKAFDLAKDVKERGRYFDKVKLVAKRAEQEAREASQRRARNSQQPIILESPQIRF